MIYKRRVKDIYQIIEIGREIRKMIKKIVCPNCKDSLIFNNNILNCSNCNKQYFFVENIPILLNEVDEPTKINLQNYYSSEANHYNVSHGSDLYGTEYNINKHYLKVFKKYIKPDGLCLEFGSGTGRFAKVLESFTTNIFLTDISPEMLLNSSDKSYPRICADTENLPFPDNCFDTCVGVTTFAYIPNKTKALKELRRVLKPGGRLLILDMNQQSFIYKFTELYYGDKRKLNRPQQIKESNLGFLKELFQKNGLSVDGTGTFSWVPHAISRRIAVPFIIFDNIVQYIPIIKRHAMRLYITGIKEI